MPSLPASLSPSIPPPLDYQHPQQGARRGRRQPGPAPRRGPRYRGRGWREEVAPAVASDAVPSRRSAATLSRLSLCSHNPFSRDYPAQFPTSWKGRGGTPHRRRTPQRAPPPGILSCHSSTPFQSYWCDGTLSSSRVRRTVLILRHRCAGAHSRTSATIFGWLFFANLFFHQNISLSLSLLPSPSRPFPGERERERGLRRRGERETAI